MRNGETKLADDNLVSWQVDEVTSTSIDISYEFKDSILVSQEDKPDLLTLNVCLQELPAVDSD